MKAVGSISLLLFVLLGAGCSTFKRDWNRAATADATHQREQILPGRWDGNWKSDVNGHHGRLRCIVNGAGTNYVARFHANYWKIFSFTYSVPLRAELQKDNCHFSGQANLGWFAGGIYSYEGSASRSEFNATYHCKYDHGTFQMSRPR